jgi:cytosine/adenosine deaminase-related metal-dependent hydrolase
MDAPETVLHVAAAIRDAAGHSARPGAVAVRDGRIIATGLVDDVQRRALDRAPDRVVDHGDSVLLPAFVNAHAHLDLTSIGTRAFEGTFLDWVGVVMRARPASPEAIRTAVEEGLRQSRDAGVGWVGDIAGSDAAVLARARAPEDVRLPGTSWLEVFGIGSRTDSGIAHAESRLTDLRAACADVRDVRVDLQPHAPYSADLALFERAAALGAPSTHLAETIAELEFVDAATGPFRDLLTRLRGDDPELRAHALSPIRAFAPALRRARWVLAHCNYVDDADLEVLAGCGDVTIAYCPIASEYFGHEGHRYRDMLARGIRVALGTDSILCQPPDETMPLGILPACRRLWVRDRTDPKTLLAMATVNGARALGLADGTATLAPGAPARIVALAIDPGDPTDAWLQCLEGRD